MNDDHQYVELEGSAREELRGSVVDGELAPDTDVTLTLVLRRRADLPRELIEGPNTISQPELAERYGADAEDIALVRRVLAGTGLSVVRGDPASRRLIVAGALDAAAATFGAHTLSRRVTTDATGGRRAFRHRQGPLRVPAELAGVVVGVFGFDDREQVGSRLRRVAGTPSATYTPLQVARAYGFPAGDGAGEVLAFVEFGGGYTQEGLNDYFASLGVTPPSTTAVSVDGAKNSPGNDPTGPDGEVQLDLEVAGALAPSARQVIYFAPNTAQGFLDAISEAVHAMPTPTVISISWGGPESSWTEQARVALDNAFADAASLGITITAAAGDTGSGDSTTGNVVDFPASSPHVLACGGTSLVLDARGGVQQETVWNNNAGSATGGGVSAVFARPSWQADAGVPAPAAAQLTAGQAAGGRGVPDVAGSADPSHGYQVLVDGQHEVLGGTSAVAPLWAALLCRIAQVNGRRLGLVQPRLYAGATPGHPVPGLRDITVGDNGGYQARAGWDACTGLGTPNGAALIARF
jgi:kumamolisin